MIREFVKTKSDKLVIDLPKEYVNKNLEILIFSNNEVEKHTKNNKSNKLIEEFDKVVKKRVKPNIKYHIGMENEVNDNDIF